MGYRLYLGSISKVNYELVKNMSLIELNLHLGNTTGVEDGEYFYDYDMDQLIVQLYCLGKYVDYATDKYKDDYKNFFNSPDIHEYFSEYGYLIVTKKFLKNIIDEYREGIHVSDTKNFELFWGEENLAFVKSRKEIDSDYDKDYNYVTNWDFDFGVLTQPQKNYIFKLLNSLISLRHEWDKRAPAYNLDMDRKSLVSSSKYEYAIFDLVRIYKTFDWENDYMVYYGY